jgi:hypothetical protein
MLWLYCDAMQQWKKTYENTGQVEEIRSLPAKPFGAAAEASSAAQNFALQIFRRAVEGQVDLWRFFERRWTAYRDIPDAVMGCRTPLDLLPLQASFVKQAAEDYANQAARILLAFFPRGKPAL